MLGVERNAGLDIAVARARLGRLDAEGHEPVAARNLASLFAGVLETILIENDMVGGKRENDGVRIALGCKRHAGGDGRTGIAGFRFEHDVGLDTKLLGLVAGEEAKIVGRDDDRRASGRFDPRESLLIGGKLACERQELLRHAVARDRPEPRAGTAGEKHGGDLWNGHRDGLSAERRNPKLAFQGVRGNV